MVTIFFYCLAFAKELPCYWQSFATPEAKSCHAGGKALPQRWQKNDT